MLDDIFQGILRCCGRVSAPGVCCITCSILFADLRALLEPPRDRGVMDRLLLKLTAAWSPAAWTELPGSRNL